MLCILEHFYARKAIYDIQLVPCRRKSLVFLLIIVEFAFHPIYKLLYFLPVIEKLRKYENETLDRHIEFFEMIRNEDERELARRFDKEHVDTKSATSMFELLRRKLSHTAAYPHLLSMLEHFLLLPCK